MILDIGDIGDIGDIRYYFDAQHFFVIFDISDIGDISVDNYTPSNFLILLILVILDIILILDILVILFDIGDIIKCAQVIRNRKNMVGQEKNRTGYKFSWHKGAV